MSSHLFSSVLALQITSGFDHRRSHHHHCLLCFQDPFRLTWTQKLWATRSLKTIPRHHTLSALCFRVPCARASHSRVHMFAFCNTVFVCPSVSFRVLCPCLVAAQHLITAVLLIVEVQKFSAFSSTLTRTLQRTCTAAQNITRPHSCGIAVSCTSTGHVLENAGKSEDSQNKFVPIATWQCYASVAWWKWSHGDVRRGLFFGLSNVIRKCVWIFF